MMVMIENRLYNARNVFEINQEANPEMLESMGIPPDPTDDEIRVFFERLNFPVLEV